MATTTESRPNAKRSANAKAEPRDEDGRFTTGTARATTRRSTTAKASSGNGEGRTTKSASNGSGNASSSNGSGSTTRSGRSKKPTRADLTSGTGAMLAAGAAGLAVGLAANVARKFAVQSPTYFAGEWDDALKAEHQLTLKVFDAIEATTESNTTKRSTLLMNLKHMLAKHAMEEENAVYPAMRDAGQTEAADHLNNDHGYVKQYLYDLTVMPKDSPSWIAKVRQFRTDIEKHMREEETELFPQLKSRLSAEKNKELTAAMNKEGLKIA